MLTLFVALVADKAGYPCATVTLTGYGVAVLGSGDTYTIGELGATIRLTLRTALAHLHTYTERTAHDKAGRTIHFGKGAYMAPEEAARLLEPEQYFTQEGSQHVGLTDEGLKYLLETYDFQYNPRHK